METTFSTASALTGSGQTGTKSTGEARSALSSDFDTFLRMLTVQVENQDPLNPVDATDYATQLATFSAVEQQIKTNELLTEIAGKTEGAALQQYGSWIGMEALVDAPVRFEGNPIAMRPQADADADRAIMVVLGPNGDEVERFDLPADQDVLLWSGLDSNGTAYPQGNYRFEVKSFDGETQLSTQSVPVYSRVEEIRTDGGGIVIRLSDGSEKPVSMVSGLRNPSV